MPARSPRTRRTIEPWPVRNGAGSLRRLGSQEEQLKRALIAASAATMLVSAPAAALDPVPMEAATTMMADDGTEVYCVYDLQMVGDTVTSVQFTDCPQLATEDVPAQNGDLSALKVGDSFTYYSGFDGAPVIATLVQAEYGVPVSSYSKPGKGMTTLGLFFTFEAGPDGGTTNLIEVFSPDGEEMESNYGASGKYAKDWPYTDLRPNKSTKGWRIYDVPKKGAVEVVMDGYDEYGEDVYATWIVEP